MVTNNNENKFCNETSKHDQRTAILSIFPFDNVPAVTVLSENYPPLNWLKRAGYAQQTRYIVRHSATQSFLRCLKKTPIVLSNVGTIM